MTAINQNEIRFIIECLINICSNLKIVLQSILYSNRISSKYDQKKKRGEQQIAVVAFLYIFLYLFRSLYLNNIETKPTIILDMLFPCKTTIVFHRITAGHLLTPHCFSFSFTFNFNTQKNILNCVEWCMSKCM